MRRELTDELKQQRVLPVVRTVAARLALGDDLTDAVSLGVAAASLSVQRVGGTGFVPSLEQTQLHPARSGSPPRVDMP